MNADRQNVDMLGTDSFTHETDIGIKMDSQRFPERSNSCCPLTSLSAAQAEWEAATTPYPLPHKQSYGKIIDEPFRRYGDAIAWLEWQDNCTITKIETLKPRTSAATSLLSFLKTLATKHGIHIYGSPVIYEPTCPLAAVLPLSQEELEAWYSKNGFLVGRSSNGVPYFWYPSPPV
jgi:hypothetical protein